MDRARRQAAFTLIELMITVAILGILASTAISGFKSYQLRTKRSESFMNLKSIATTENSYFATAGVFIGAVSSPGPFPGAAPRNWTAGAEAVFGPLGWRPEGVVYFDYDVNALNGAVSTCPATCVECFTTSAYGDTDGDGRLSVVMYVKEDKTGNTCPAMITGNATPLDRLGNPILDAPAINTLADDF